MLGYHFGARQQGITHSTHDENFYDHFPAVAARSSMLSDVQTVNINEKDRIVVSMTIGERTNVSFQNLNCAKGTAQLQPNDFTNV